MIQNIFKGPVKAIKKTWAAVMLLLCATALFAQTVSPKTLLTKGGYFTGGNLQLQYSIGEPLNSTFTAGGHEFSLGFEQPDMNIVVGSVAAGPYCAGTAISIPFRVRGVFATNNIFAAELSDSSGSFVSTQIIGVDTTDHSDTIRAVIPYNVNTSAYYKVRVLASGLNLTSDVSNVFSVISAPASILPVPSTNYVCRGSSVDIKTFGVQLGNRYDLMFNSTVIATEFGVSDTLILNTGIIDTSSAYYILETDTNTGCQSTLNSLVPIRVNQLEGSIYYVPLTNDTLLDSLQFSAVSLCATGWIWEFPGASSVSSYTVKNPIVTYNSVASDTVYLTVTNGADTSVRKQLIFRSERSAFSANIVQQNLTVCAGTTQTVQIQINGGMNPPYTFTLGVVGGASFSPLVTAVGLNTSNTDAAINGSFVFTVNASESIQLISVTDANGNAAIISTNVDGSPWIVNYTVVQCCSANIVTDGNFSNCVVDFFVDPAVWNYAGNPMDVFTNGLHMLCNSGACPSPSSINQFDSGNGDIGVFDPTNPECPHSVNSAIFDNPGGANDNLQDLGPALVVASGIGAHHTTNQGVVEAFTIDWAQNVTIEPCTDYQFSFNTISFPNQMSIPWQGQPSICLPCSRKFRWALINNNTNNLNLATETGFSSNTPQCPIISGQFTPPITPLSPNSQAIGGGNNIGTVWVQTDFPMWHSGTASGTYSLQIWEMDLEVGRPRSIDVDAAIYPIDNITLSKIGHNATNSNQCLVTGSQNYNVCQGKGIPIGWDPAGINALPSGATVTWTPATGLSCSTCPFPTASPTSTTTYTGIVSINSGNYCGSTILKATVNVINCNCNGSSPTYTFNGDYTDAEIGPTIEAAPAGTTIAINGTLTVNSFMYLANLTTQVNVLFGPGAKIEVPSGGSLFVYNAFLHACNLMWQGIDVEAGGSLGMYGSVTGNCNLGLKQTEISDALYAVHLHDGASFTSQYATYSNNFVGIYFSEPGARSQIFSIHMANPLCGNTFKGTRPLFPSYPDMATGSYQPQVTPVNQVTWAWAGIHVLGMENLTIGAPSGAGCLINHFTGMANGIIDQGGNLTVVNSQFTEMHASYAHNLILMDGLPSQGNGILCADSKYFSGIRQHQLTQTGFGLSGSYSFSNCEQGIVADAVDANIQGNNMTNSYGVSPVGIKIQLDHIGLITVKDNKISCPSRGIQFLSDEPSVRRVVSNNYIYITGAAAGSIGLEVNERGAPPPNGIANNSYNNNHIYLNSSLANVGISFNTANAFYAYTNYVYPSASTWFGMQYTNCSVFTDQANTVLGPGTNPTNLFGQLPAGIYYSSCTGIGTTPHHTSHDCNTVDEMYTGMLFSGPNTGNTFISGNKFNENFTSTHVKLMHDGMLIGNSATIDAQTNAGNQWFGNDDGASTDYTYSGKRMNFQNVGHYASFTTTSSIGTSYRPNNFELYPAPPIATLFLAAPAGSEDSSCSGGGGGGCGGCGGARLEALDRAIINDTASFDSSGFPSQVLWLNQDQVYRKLLANPALLDSASNADSFFVAIRNSPMGQLTSVDSIWVRGTALDSASVAGWTAKLLAIDSLTQLIPPIDSLLADTTDATTKDSIGLVTHKQAIYDAISSLDTTTDSVIVMYYANKSGAATAALALNESISPGNTIESNTVLYNEIYYSTLAIDSTGFDSTRVAQLYYLASQCPISGGNAVYAARSLLSLLVDTMFNDIELCTTGEGRMMHVKPAATTDAVIKKLSVKMYPNPASDYAILQLSGDVSPLTLKITDAIGKTLLNQPIVTTGGFYRINTAAFSSGLYYITLYNQDNRVFSDKLSIFK